jgi:hypothetical protein
MRTTALAARSRLVRQCGLATGGNPEECTLWVSYADPASLRRRLVGVAQQVRELLVARPLPELVLPLGNRVRQGFWFMRFETPELLSAAQTLHGTAFASDCGTLSGRLQLDAGLQPLDLRAVLNLPTRSPDPIEEWLRAKFGAHGLVERVRLPRLRNQWDQGLAFVHFADVEAAEAALEALDGTPSLVPGCNLFIDIAAPRPLVREAV